MSRFSFAICIVLTTLLNPSVAWKVTLYDDTDFKGHGFDLATEGCTNIPGEINDATSSIHTHGTCVRIYEHGLCEGEMREMFPGSPSHTKLSEIGFDNRLSSVGPCPKGFKTEGLLSLIYNQPYEP